MVQNSGYQIYLNKVHAEVMVISARWYDVKNLTYSALQTGTIFSSYIMSLI